MKKENIYIAGDSLVIKSVKEQVIDDYLYIERFATILKAMYDKENGFWEYMKPRLLDDMNGSDIICLIYLRKSNKAIGYIELEMNEINHPKVGIGILEEERKKDMLLRPLIF